MNDKFTFNLRKVKKTSVFMIISFLDNQNIINFGIILKILRS